MNIKLLNWICEEFDTDYPIFSCEDCYVILNIPREVTAKQIKYLKKNNVTQEEDGFWTASI